MAPERSFYNFIVFAQEYLDFPTVAVPKGHPACSMETGIAWKPVIVISASPKDTVDLPFRHAVFYSLGVGQRNRVL
jgi:hypothetical protein